MDVREIMPGDILSCLYAGRSWLFEVESVGSKTVRAVKGSALMWDEDNHGFFPYEGTITPFVEACRKISGLEFDIYNRKAGV